MIPIMFHQVPVDCINQAAVTYLVPAPLILSILETEGGRVGDVSRNKNGTVDLGPMQINSSWLPLLSKYGYTEDQIQNNACANVMVGTWILSQAIANQPISQNYWQGVGNYNSHTPVFNERYQSKVKTQYAALLARIGGANE